MPPEPRITLPPPQPPRMIKLYEVEVDPAAQRCESLSSKFAMEASAWVETPSALIRRGNTGRLEVFRNSNSFRWRRERDGWKPPRRDCKIPPQEAEAIARAFLTERALWKEPRATKVASTTVGLGAGQPQTWKPEVLVIYSYDVEGTEVCGPGFRTVVTIGADGAVTEMYRFEHTPRTSTFHLAQTDQGYARALLRAWLTVRLPGELGRSIDERLAYLAGPPSKRQPFLLPFYVYHWKTDVTGEGGRTNPFNQLIPALRDLQLEISPFKFVGDTGVLIP